MIHSPQRRRARRVNPFFRPTGDTVRRKGHRMHSTVPARCCASPPHSYCNASTAARNFSMAASPRLLKKISSLRTLRLCGETLFSSILHPCVRYALCAMLYASLCVCYRHRRYHFEVIFIIHRKPEGQTGGIKRNHFYRRRMIGNNKIRNEIRDLNHQPDNLG